MGKVIYIILQGNIFIVMFIVSDLNLYSLYISVFQIFFLDKRFSMKSTTTVINFLNLKFIEK